MIPDADIRNIDARIWRVDGHGEGIARKYTISQYHLQLLAG